MSGNADYKRGHVSVELDTLNFAIGGKTENLLDCTFGLEVHPDGRVWVCINGATWLRFKPNGKPVGDVEATWD